MMTPVTRHNKSGNCFYLYRQKTKNLPQRSKNKKTAWGKYLIIVFVLGYILFSFGLVEWQIYRLDKQIESYEQQRQLLEIENAALEIQAKKLHDHKYIETLARESLGLIKDGEKVLTEAKPGGKGIIDVEKEVNGSIQGDLH